MYDKLGIILRIETTVNDVSFFKTPPEGGTSGWHLGNERSPVEEIHL